MRPADLGGSLTASIDPGSSLIQITATASTPGAAATLANGALHALADVVHQVESQADVTTAQFTVIPMGAAAVPTRPTSIGTVKALLIGAAGGLLLGLLAIALRRSLDNKVRSGTALAQTLGVGVLGRIPKLNRHDAAEGVVAHAGEPMRHIRTGLKFASVAGRLHSVVITSPNEAEGKSTVAAALARVMAETGQPTLIVDADIRRPKVADMFGIDATVGLTEVLSEQASMDAAIRSTSVENLFVLPAGRTPPNPSELLGSNPMRMLLKTAARTYFVIVDTAPLLPVTDAVLTAAATDGAVLVVAAGRTHNAEATAARDLLTRAGVRVLGAVLNMVPPRDESDGYSYRRQYGQYAHATTKAEAAGGSGDAITSARRRYRARAAEGGPASSRSAKAPTSQGQSR